MPMKSRMETVSSRAMLERIANQPGNVVYQVTHDDFEPWPADDVRAMMDRLVAITATAASAEDARQRALRVDRAGEFASKYKTLWEKVTEPAFVKSSELLQILYDMVRMHGRVQRGELTKAEADEIVSKGAYDGLMKAVGTAKKEAGEGESEEVRKQGK